VQWFWTSSGSWTKTDMTCAWSKTLFSQLADLCTVQSLTFYPQLAMVCDKCEKKLGVSVQQDVWKAGSRSTVGSETGKAKLTENKLLTAAKGSLTLIRRIWRIVGSVEWQPTTLQHITVKRVRIRRVSVLCVVRSWWWLRTTRCLVPDDMVTKGREFERVECLTMAMFTE